MLRRQRSYAGQGREGEKGGGEGKLALFFAICMLLLLLVGEDDERRFLLAFRRKKTTTPHKCRFLSPKLKKNPPPLCKKSVCGCCCLFPICIVQDASIKPQVEFAVVLWYNHRLCYQVDCSYVSQLFFRLLSCLFLFSFPFSFLFLLF